MLHAGLHTLLGPDRMVCMRRDLLLHSARCAARASPRLFSTCMLLPAWTGHLPCGHPRLKRHMHLQPNQTVKQPQSNHWRAAHLDVRPLSRLQHLSEHISMVQAALMSPKYQDQLMRSSSAGNAWKLPKMLLSCARALHLPRSSLSACKACRACPLQLRAAHRSRQASVRQRRTRSRT